MLTSDLFNQFMKISFLPVDLTDALENAIENCDPETLNVNGRQLFAFSLFRSATQILFSHSLRSN